MGKWKWIDSLSTHACFGLWIHFFLIIFTALVNVKLDHNNEIIAWTPIFVLAWISILLMLWDTSTYVFFLYNDLYNKYSIRMEQIMWMYRMILLSSFREVGATYCAEYVVMWIAILILSITIPLRADNKFDSWTAAFSPILLTALGFIVALIYQFARMKFRHVGKAVSMCIVSIAVSITLILLGLHFDGKLNGSLWVLTSPVLALYVIGGIATIIASIISKDDAIMLVPLYIFAMIPAISHILVILKLEDQRDYSWNIVFTPLYLFQSLYLIAKYAFMMVLGTAKG